MDKKRAWFIAILFFSGLCLTLYPFVSNLIAQSHASQAIVAYDEQVAEMDQEQIDAAKEAVRKYNEQLNAAVEASAMQGEDGISYLDLVDVGESIGFIEIPKIDVYLPIYSGTGEDVLQKGVGHLAESSYPIGGTSTHSVLTGHRGLPSAVLFTDLDKLEEGDVFYLHVLDEVLAYKVDQIKVVLPEEPRTSGSWKERITVPLSPVLPMPSTPIGCWFVASGPSTSRRRSWQNRMQYMKYSPRPSRSGSWMYGRGWSYPC